MIKLTTEHSNEIRALIKDLTDSHVGVELSTSRKFIRIGTQCKRLKSIDALRIVNHLIGAGYFIDDLDTTLALIKKGICDVISVYRINISTQKGDLST